MLQQLQPFASMRVADLRAEACDANASSSRKVWARPIAPPEPPQALHSRNRRAGLRNPRQSPAAACAPRSVKRQKARPKPHCRWLKLYRPAVPSAPQGMVKVAKAESLLRRMLQRTPAGLFQHMMRTVNSQVRTQEEPQHGRRSAERDHPDRSPLKTQMPPNRMAPTRPRRHTHPPTLRCALVQVLGPLDPTRTGYVDLAALLMALVALW